MTFFIIGGMSIYKILYIIKFVVSLFGVCFYNEQYLPPPP